MHKNEFDYFVLPSQAEETLNRLLGSADQIKSSLEKILGPLENIHEELTKDLSFSNSVNEIMKKLAPNIPDIEKQIFKKTPTNFTQKNKNSDNSKKISPKSNNAIALNSDNDRKILIISIVVLLTCVSYNEILLRKIFQFVIENAESLYIKTIITSFAFALFPDSSDKIFKLLEELIKK